MEKRFRFFQPTLIHQNNHHPEPAQIKKKAIIFDLP